MTVRKDYYNTIANPRSNRLSNLRTSPPVTIGRTKMKFSDIDDPKGAYNVMTSRALHRFDSHKFNTTKRHNNNKKGKKKCNKCQHK